MQMDSFHSMSAHKMCAKHSKTLDKYPEKVYTIGRNPTEGKDEHGTKQVHRTKKAYHHEV